MSSTLETVVSFVTDLDDDNRCYVYLRDMTLQEIQATKDFLDDAEDVGHVCPNWYVGGIIKDPHQLDFAIFMADLSTVLDMHEEE